MWAKEFAAAAEDDTHGPDFMVNISSDVLFGLDSFQAFPYLLIPGDPCVAGLTRAAE